MIGYKNNKHLPKVKNNFKSATIINTFLTFRHGTLYFKRFKNQFHFFFLKKAFLKFKLKKKHKNEFQDVFSVLQDRTANSFLSNSTDGCKHSDTFVSRLFRNSRILQLTIINGEYVDSEMISTKRKLQKKRKST